MNISSILNVLLATALVILSIKIAFFSHDKQDKNGNKNLEDSVVDNIMTRTSIRDFQDKPLEDEKVEKLLRTAMAAPSARNEQPWSFIVIKDKKILQAISANFNNIKMAEKAPLAIVVCGDLDKSIPGDGLTYWVQDTSAATENLLLAAHSMGLGAVWCGIYPIQERVALLKNILKIPENIIPLNVIPVGYPAEDPAPKDKWNPDLIHYNMWNSK